MSRRRADLKATFGAKRHELNVSTYQMVVLLLFNSADRLSYHEIQAATAIAPADLKRSLQSLACVKARSARARTSCLITQSDGHGPVTQPGNRSLPLCAGVGCLQMGAFCRYQDSSLYLGKVQANT